MVNEDCEASYIRLETERTLQETHTQLNLLLFSDDEALARLVRGFVVCPWTMVPLLTEHFFSHKILPAPKVRLVILDDQTVSEDDRGRLLKQIGEHFAGQPLLYIAGDYSEHNEIRARASGAHFYDSKPLSYERFGRVLQSFLSATGFKG